MKRALLAITMVGAVLAGVRVLGTERWDDDRRDRDEDRKMPLVIGHRGATGYLPEHTLASYKLAILRGADYIEPDLVSTKDGVLIARHEVNITETTNVAGHPEFASRLTEKTIDGIKERGWFADDFTLAEIKTLRAKQRLAFRPQEFNDFYQVPTFDEVIELAQSWGRYTGRVIGVYPETKHPTYHRGVRLPLEEKLLRSLERHGWGEPGSPVFIQSFEVGNLRRLNRMTRLPLVQLVDANDVRVDGSIDSDGYGPYDFKVSGDPRTYADLVTPAGLAEIATYADGVGPWKRYIVSVAGVDANHDGQADDVNHDGTVDDSDKKVLPPTTLIRDAHRLGLIVHTWTFRNEQRYQGGDYGESPAKEYVQFYCLGIDGLFSDFPDTAVTARTLLQLAPRLCGR
ncbi:MAG: glycerophosphodiester phosphodiesterase [Vicinamibacterales bacterium]|nr:glycerophosphodiester phosphodiesterase [Vicinamibacterales bacterium]